MRYFSYSSYLKKKYGEKVYKLPINIETNCPNRDGNISFGGCTFCGENAANFELLDVNLSVKEQLRINKDIIGKKYGARKYIAYFQNYSNTYILFDTFKKLILESLEEDIVEISISTRPDAVDDKILKFLESVKKEHNVNITLELGLQSINHKTLKKINRGHSLAEFIDATLKTQKYGLQVCVHIILNLPWDDLSDIIETAKVISALKVDFVKIHSLYILKGTVMEKQYLNNEFKIIEKEEYVERAILFLRYLDPSIAIQRLLARAAEDKSVFCNWSTSWWKIRDSIVKKMEKEDVIQGDLFNYLNGSALKKFEEENYE